MAGTSKAHGEGGVKFADEARQGLGLPEEKFYVAPEVREYFARHAAGLEAAGAAWHTRFEAWRQANGDLAAELDTAVAKNYPDLLECIPE